MGELQVAKVFRSIKSSTEKANIRAVNRAAKSAFSATSKYIRDSYSIKKENLDKYAKLTNATLTRPVAILTVNRKAIPLMQFRAKQNKKGVAATQKKGGRKVFRGTFIATMKSGHTGVFVRTSENKNPIKELFGPAGMDLSGSQQAQDYLERVYLARFEKELEAQLKYYLGK